MAVQTSWPLSGMTEPNERPHHSHSLLVTICPSQSCFFIFRPIRPSLMTHHPHRFADLNNLLVSRADRAELDVREDDVGVGILGLHLAGDAACDRASSTFSAGSGRGLRVGGVEPAHACGVIVLQNPRISQSVLIHAENVEREMLALTQIDRTRTMPASRALLKPEKPPASLNLFLSPVTDFV